VKAGQAGQLSHALILNPYLVIKRLHERGHLGLTEDKYNALVERAIEIGATDLDDDDDYEEEEGKNEEAAPANIDRPRRAASKTRQGKGQKATAQKRKAA
jgi:hypothetical protein